MKTNINLKPIHDMNTKTNPSSESKPRVYVLHPFPPVPAPASTPSASSASPAPKPALPAPQPLPKPVLHPGRPTLKLGLDVHLEFIMAVAQRDHASPLAPRKFTPEQLVAQVQKWVAEGLVVYSVQESCGFGFVLHRNLVEIGRAHV